jgi:hypothetical protein
LVNRFPQVDFSDISIQARSDPTVFAQPMGLGETEDLQLFVAEPATTQFSVDNPCKHDEIGMRR